MTRRSKLNEVVTEADALAWLRRAQRKFGTPHVTLVITTLDRSWYGWWQDTGRTIRLSYRSVSPRTTHSIKAALVHEFAHHLNQCTNGSRDFHGKPFFKALWKVVRWSYRDEADYPWADEYSRVRALGTRRLTKLEARRERAK